MFGKRIGSNSLIYSSWCSVLNSRGKLDLSCSMGSSLRSLFLWLTLAFITAGLGSPSVWAGSPQGPTGRAPGQVRVIGSGACVLASRCGRPLAQTITAGDQSGAASKSCGASAKRCVCEACCTTLCLPRAQASSLGAALLHVWRSASLFEPIAHVPQVPRRPPRRLS